MSGRIKVLQVAQMRDLLLPGIWGQCSPDGEMDFQIDPVRDVLVFRAFSRKTSSGHSQDLVSQAEIDDGIEVPAVVGRMKSLISEWLSDNPDCRGLQ